MTHSLHYTEIWAEKLRFALMSTDLQNSFSLFLYLCKYLSDLNQGFFIFILLI